MHDQEITLEQGRLVPGRHGGRGGLGALTEPDRRIHDRLQPPFGHFERSGLVTAAAGRGRRRRRHGGLRGRVHDRRRGRERPRRPLTGIGPAPSSPADSPPGSSPDSPRHSKGRTSDPHDRVGSSGRPRGDRDQPRTVGDITTKQRSQAMPASLDGVLASLPPGRGRRLGRHPRAHGEWNGHDGISNHPSGGSWTPKGRGAAPSAGSLTGAESPAPHPDQAMTT